MLYYFPKRDAINDESPPYVIWDNCFTPRQLDMLQGMARKSSITGLTGRDLDNSSTSNDGYRSSLIQWLERAPETEWVYEKLAGVIQQVNFQYYNFDLLGLGESAQLSNYKSDANGGYNWHIDCMSTGYVRKLSFSMQLCHPDEYEGGDLEVKISDEPIKIERKRGLITIFPSWTLHRVTRVTSGERQSLVQWVSGPKFR